MSCDFSEIKEVFDRRFDSYHFFQSQTHTKALKLLSDPVDDTLNIRVLVGVPGTGKTLVLFSLLEQWRSSALTARLFWTQLPGDEFIQYFLSELGVARRCGSMTQAREELARVLEENFSRGRQVVVAIDEAHHLSNSTLRRLAEVLNSPLGRSKNLRVILAGLPSLAERLRSRKLVEVGERISAVASLGPLTSAESALYMKQKLEILGARIDECFMDSAVELIANLSAGIPKEINNLCFKVAYGAEQRGSGKIDPGLVLELLPEHADEARRDVPSREVAIAKCSHAQNGFIYSSAPVGTLSREELLALLDEWFGYERLAWSGTVGELAALLGLPESGLVQLLSSSSESLHSLGIELGVVESYGRTASIWFRSLETRKRTAAEIAPSPEPNVAGKAAAGVSLSTEAKVPTDPIVEGTSAEPGVEEDQALTVRQLAVPHDQNTELQSSSEGEQMRMRSSLQNGASELSAFDQTLSELVTAAFDTPEPARSGFGRVIVPALLFIVAVALVLAITHSSLLRQESTDRHSPTPSSTEQPSTGAQEQTRNEVPLQRKPTPIPNPNSSLLQAARSGNAEAQFNLGTAYVTGRGVPLDPVTGYTWLTLAFANGNKRAEDSIRQLTPTINPDQIARIRRNLGEMYADGIGVRPDKVTAYMWHFLAEQSGDAQSRTDIARLARTMTPDQQSEAQARAHDWLRKHQQSRRPATPAS